MDLAVRFLGAAQTVMGSKYLVEANGRPPLIECGLYQGLKRDGVEGIRRPPDTKIGPILHGQGDRRRIRWAQTSVRFLWAQGEPMEQEALVVKKLIVGTEGRPEDEQALTALCASLDGERVHLRLVHVLTVARTAPLDVPMPEAEQQADRLLARSKKIVERFHIPVETAVLRGREVGACLIEEARRTTADAICVRFRSRAAPMGHYVVSATVSTLLNAAPCPVITFHMPHRRH